MAIEQILPYDWSVNISTSSHTDIYDYANALTNVDSTTYGSYTAFSSTPSSYLLFRVSDLPQSITSAQFKIKARITSAMPCSICSTVQYNGTTYNSDAITATAQTATLYDIQLPREVSLSNLKKASAIYITITPSSGAGLYVFGTELNIDTTVYKIFNMILPR